MAVLHIMQIQVNGQLRETRAQNLAQLLEELEFGAPQNAPVGIAVAVNGGVVRRAMHAECVLSEGDQIEIIRAVQGG